MSKPSRQRILLPAGLLVVVVASIIACRDRQLPLFVISGPQGIQSFQIATEDGEVLWSVTASQPTTLQRIDYGVVPAGFHQLTPESNHPPRFLIPGEWLETKTVSVDATFYHAGMATSPETFQPVTSRLVLSQSETSSPD